MEMANFHILNPSVIISRTYYFDSFSSNRSQPWAVGDSVTNTISYSYDPLYRLTAADYSDSTTFHYTYDAVGNRTSETTVGVPVSSYSYDIANRLTSVDGVSYTWDSNGNLLSDGVNMLMYNTANRLTGVRKKSTVSCHQYMGWRIRLQQTINSVSMNYNLDFNPGFIQVLSDGTNTYLYRESYIAQENMMTEYFLGDALGSIHQMMDGAGIMTYTASYTLYAEVMSSTLG